jgi:hypothetical protein
MRGEAMNPAIMQALGAEHVREMHESAAASRHARRARRMSRLAAGIRFDGRGLTRRRDGLDQTGLPYAFPDLSALDSREAWAELEGRADALN